MDEYILNQVPNQNFQEPWLISRFNAWKQELLEEAKRKAIESGQQIATAGSNLLATTEQHDERLLEETTAAENAATLLKEDQFLTDKAISDANIEGEDFGSQHGLDRRSVEYQEDAVSAAEDLRGGKKDMDLMEQAFLMTMMENMRGEDIGQAPAAVAGGGQRQWPSMMGQFAPWEQQKPYWWMR